MALQANRPGPEAGPGEDHLDRSDPRIHAVDRAWSSCMARHFYHYGTPQQVEHRQWPTPPDKAEIATAVADVTCKTQTNLLNTWPAVEAAYQQALIGQNLATLAQLRRSPLGGRQPRERPQEKRPRPQWPR